MSGERWRIVTLPLERGDVERLPPVPTYWQAFAEAARFGLGCSGVFAAAAIAIGAVLWWVGVPEIVVLAIGGLPPLIVVSILVLYVVRDLPQSLQERRKKRRLVIEQGKKTRLVVTVTEIRRARESKGGWVTIGKIDERTYVVLASTSDSNPEFDSIGEHVTLDFIPGLLERPPITSHGQRINVATRLDVKLGGPFVYFAGDVIVLHHRNTGANRAPEPWPRVVDAEPDDFRHEQIDSLFGGDGDTAAR